MAVYLNGKLLEELYTSPYIYDFIRIQFAKPAMQPTIKTIIPPSTLSPTLLGHLFQNSKKTTRNIESHTNKTAIKKSELPCAHDKIISFTQGEGVLVRHDDPEIEGTTTQSIFTCASFILRDKRGNYFHGHLSFEYQAPWEDILKWFKERQNDNAEANTTIDLSLEIYGAYAPEEHKETSYYSWAGYILGTKSLIEANKQHPDIKITIQKQICLNENTTVFQGTTGNVSMPILKDFLITKDAGVVYEVSPLCLWKTAPIDSIREFRSNLGMMRVHKHADYKLSSEILPRVNSTLQAEKASNSLNYRPMPKSSPLRLITTKTTCADYYEEVRQLFTQVYPMGGQEMQNVTDFVNTNKHKKILSMDDFYLLAKSKYPNTHLFSLEEKTHEIHVIYYHIYLYAYNHAIYKELVAEFKLGKYTDKNIELLGIICETFSDAADRSKAYSTLGSFYRERWRADGNTKFFDLAEKSFSIAIELDNTNTSAQDKQNHLFLLTLPAADFDFPTPPGQQNAQQTPLPS